MTHWLSLDLATKSGVALWHGDELVEAWSLAPNRKGTEWNLVPYVRPMPGGIPSYTTATEFDAWDMLMHRSGVTGVVAERGHGEHAKAIDSLARRRGYVCGLAHAWGVTDYFELHQSTWRARAARVLGVRSWPKTRAAAKALAVEVVRRRWRITVPDDTAEAVVIGIGAQALRIMPPKA